MSSFSVEAHIILSKIPYADYCAPVSKVIFIFNSDCSVKRRPSPGGEGVPVELHLLKKIERETDFICMLNIIYNV